MTTLATLRNMRENYGHGVIAYSPATGEECSADPGDYFWLPEDESLEDADGTPMVLARTFSSIELIGEQAK